MTECLTICSKKADFIFDNDDNLNIFNLLRLIRHFNKDNEILIDVSNLNQQHQLTITSKFTGFLTLYSEIIKPTQDVAYLAYSGIKEEQIKFLNTKHDFIKDNNTLIFDVVKSKSQNKRPLDPHYVKNARGVALLSLVQDLMVDRNIKNTFSIFSENSPIKLHSSSILLYNEENSKMLWNVLDEWDHQDISQYRTQINGRISRSYSKKRILDETFKIATKPPLSNSIFRNFVESLQTKLNLSSDIYKSGGKLNLWLIDDQFANGWLKLISSFVSDIYIDITALSDKSDVSLQLELLKSQGLNKAPDIAIVDLRLSDNDDCVEGYIAQDLSGFEVVDILHNKWGALSIMIASASSKLWNMEKAIKKGAVAYWRKSDEISDSSYQSALFTAFDIHLQLIEKLTVSTNRTRYRYIFRILEVIKMEVNNLDYRYDLLKRIIENYAYSLEQKVSWSCWYNCSDEKANDSIYLEISEIFNELENHLWDPKSDTLTLVPNKKVQARKDTSDKQIINDTLEYFDDKYQITGQALKEHYEKYKRIRNKLPIIHGSETARDVQHADFTNIESALLIVWCLLHELKLSSH